MSDFTKVIIIILFFMIVMVIAGNDYDETCQIYRKNGTEFSHQYCRKH